MVAIDNALRVKRTNNRPVKTLSRESPNDSLPEQQLLALAKAGEERAFELIVQRYRWLVNVRARNYFLQGAEYEDLVQEGTIGLFKAARDFRPDGSHFRSFADLCITRQIITAVKAASRQKHLPLNSALSLDAPRYDDSSRTIGDSVIHHGAPFDIMQSGTEVQEILRVLRKRLSPLEYNILSHWLEGRSYDEIATILGRHAKAVDTGLWRAKRKIRRLLNAGLITKGGT